MECIFALLSLCIFFIVSSHADLDFIEGRGKCVDTAHVLIVKICVDIYCNACLCIVNFIH